MKLFFSLLLSLCFFSGTSQNTFKDTLKQQMVLDWVRAKVYTQEYLDAMPADKYGFRPVDSMRSFAEQMLHLANVNAGMAFISTGTPFPFPSHNFENSPTAKNKDSVEYYVNTSYDFVIQVIKNLDLSKLDEVVSWKLPGGLRTATRQV